MRKKQIRLQEIRASHDARKFNAGHERTSNDPFRHYDPVVLNGNDLYELIGVDPLAIVGFR